MVPIDSDRVPNPALTGGHRRRAWSVGTTYIMRTFPDGEEVLGKPPKNTYIVWQRTVPRLA